LITRSDHAAARAVRFVRALSDHIRLRHWPSQRFTLGPGYANPDVEKFRGTSVTTAHLDGVMIDGRHHMQVRVFYEDTDFSGIVYHANYLRFMERGRTNHLRLMGAEQHALFAEAQAETPGFAFVVRSMQIDFLKPARMDDVLDVVTWPVAVKGASITLGQEVRRGEDVLVKAQVRVAFISEGRAQPIPKALRVLLKADL
jgi:acyl-CoA thioester hydrolase